jgi:hypothetical protein
MAPKKAAPAAADRKLMGRFWGGSLCRAIRHTRMHASVAATPTQAYTSAMVSPIQQIAAHHDRTGAGIDRQSSKGSTPLRGCAAASVTPVRQTGIGYVTPPPRA